MSVATIGFSSEAFVPQIFLAYYNYRYYMPALGKWCNRDPLGEKNMLTLYAMTKNDSINHFDNLGLTCCNGKQLKSNECCFKNQVHIRSFGISSDINGQCCVRLTTICLTRSYLHLNIEIAGISYSYGMKSNWGMLVFPQFWNSAKVYQSPSGNTKIKCFKVTLPVASTLIQEMNKLVEGDTSYQGSYGLISWGEHGSNCRSFSQTFYNEFKRFEYNGDYPECK